MATRSSSPLFSPAVMLILSIIAGTLAWEVLAAFLALGNVQLGLTTGPVGFDAGVLSFYMEVNPGTFVGLFLGYRFGQRSTTGSKRRSSSRSKKSGGARENGGAAAQGSEGKGSPANGGGGDG